MFFTLPLEIPFGGAIQTYCASSWSYCCWKSHVMLCVTSGWLVVWISVVSLVGLGEAVVSLVGLGEAVSIRVGMLLGICQRWRLFLSVIWPRPSIRTWYCLFGSTSTTVPLLSHFLKYWRLLLMFWIKTVVPIANGFEGWAVWLYVWDILVFCWVTIVFCWLADKIQSL